MSIQKRQKYKNCPFVLVEAFGGEPVQMVAIGREGERIEVARAIDSASIRLPIQCVREYDESTAANIRDAYEQGDMENVRTLWNQAEQCSIPESKG